MKIVMILVPVMLVLVTLGIVLFSWAVKTGQYDDLDGPAHRILYDDDKDLIPDDAKPSETDTAARRKQPADDKAGDNQTS